MQLIQVVDFLVNHISNNVLVLEYISNAYNLRTKLQVTQLFKWAQYLNIDSSKDAQIVNKHRKNI